MSINHYSSLDLPETTLWWTQHQQHPQQQHQQHILMEPIPNPSWSLHHHHNQPTWFNSHNPTINTPRFNLNNEEDEEEQDHNTTTTTNNNEQTPTSQQEGGEEEQEEEEDKEPMFEKPLTPSDVGKLNRLVIPKQHAEKYFPLGASTAASDSGVCKGLLLSFEDESGKCWRFRYSYWNSSQSYVLTKGWSRYVKDKRLDAGDVVSFERHRDDAQRLFIRWRRRSGAAVAAQVSRVGHGAGGGGDGNNGNGRSGGGVVGWTSGFYCAHPSNPTHHHHLAYQQQHDGLHAGSQGPNQRTRPVGNCSSSSSSSSSKVLRLFGVNMECQPQHDSGPSTPECSYNMPSTQGSDTHHFYHHHQPPSNYSSSNTHPHMVRQQPDYY